MLPALDSDVHFFQLTSNLPASASIVMVNLLFFAAACLTHRIINTKNSNEIFLLNVFGLNQCSINMHCLSIYFHEISLKES